MREPGRDQRRWLGPVAVGGGISICTGAPGLIVAAGAPTRQAPTDGLAAVLLAVFVGWVVTVVLLSLGSLGRKLRPRPRETPSHVAIWPAGLSFLWVVALATNAGGLYWHGAIAIFGGCAVLWSWLAVLSITGYARLRSGTGPRRTAPPR